MSSHIVFDTNYLRSLGSKEYLEGALPEKLGIQIQTAIERGDIVAIPRTVQLELNAWVKELAVKDAANIKQAWELLNQKGFKISHEPNDAEDEIDIFSIIKQQYKDVYLLEPTIENYLDAEHRASFRLPPLPKKPEGEEFRNRIIWSQLISISQQSELPIAIVSNDRIFENGASSEEGCTARINNLKTEDDLNQWLDQRPPSIQTLIEDILTFKEQLLEKGIEITEDDIDRVTDYRSMRDTNGNIIKKYILVITGADKLPRRIRGKLTYHAETPALLDMEIKDDILQIYKQMSPQEEFEVEIKRQMESSKRQDLETELKHLIGG